MNIVEAVLVFAAITAVFEFIVLMKIRPRTRLRILGSSSGVGLIHAIAFGLNLAVHYGSVTGSMTAITASLVSFATVPLVRMLSGYIHDGRYYNGLLKYDPSQL
jgi:hypothetical protein